MIDKEKAVEIARLEMAKGWVPLAVHEGIPEGLAVYSRGPWTKESVWCVLFPPFPDGHGVGGCRALVVDRSTGEVLADQRVGE